MPKSAGLAQTIRSEGKRCQHDHDVTDRRRSPRSKTPARQQRHEGYDHRWKRVRDVHLTEFPLCKFCGDIAKLVDHIVPVVVDPTRRLDPTNLRSLCTPCHAIVTTNFKLTGINEPASK